MDTKKFLSTLGRRIRLVRRVKKLSQETLAERSETHPSYISEIELGKTNASIYTYYKIATALGVSLQELTAIHLGRANHHNEEQIALLISMLRRLPRKRQSIFLSGIISLIKTAG
ncbi:MAG: helix-turn-helix transcriptional regulator [candidate division Zixibacteria bacterium]|nr:helix-turn-helix transcriptional regulator [Phycisphaerae bacterium]NIR63107.1 helix-turn-helix transcriptional regulator [candidate division Zixibacteria bacterium]NIS45106.1 helix-turn-helix transcriptional regulator [candidate division Zixibacteria bacterium]NIT53242.1 helix-turn-helix transcriptional regulator [candidate division Zixibacteria bacterium]NIU13235.1 helix-turn-helix transcriptional regulator [candidate division Zixibacteria bacterium]